MERRRYGEVTSGSGKSHQGRRITMAQPVSSIIGDLVKRSRSIAHSDDFEGRKLIQTNFRQLILLDLNMLYWCPASRDQIKPVLVQPQISCNANGLAVANPIGRAMIQDDIRIWGPLAFRNQICGWPDVHQGGGQISRRSLLSYQVLSTQRLRVGIKPFIPLPAESVAGFVGASSAPSVVCSALRRFAPCCAVLRRLAVCAVLRDGVRWCRWWTQQNNRAMRPQCFIPTSQKHSPARTTRQRQTRRPRLLFSFSTNCLHQRQ